MEAIVMEHPEVLQQLQLEIPDYRFLERKEEKKEEQETVIIIEMF